MIITKNIGVYCEKNNFKELEKYLEQENFQVEKSKGRIKYEIQLDNYVFEITVVEITGNTRISSLSTAKVVSGYDEIKSFCDSFIRSEEKETLPAAEEPPF